MLRLNKNSHFGITNRESAQHGGDWLLVPSSVAMAGAWIVWLACAAGFFWLRSDPIHQPGAAWWSLSFSALAGAMAASPFFAMAVVFRWFGWASRSDAPDVSLVRVNRDDA